MAALVTPYLGPCYSAKGVFPDGVVLVVKRSGEMVVLEGTEQEGLDK
jgi:hypothetical protein